MSDLSIQLLFFTQLTFGLILDPRDISRLGIHPFCLLHIYKHNYHGCQPLLNFAIKSENKPLLLKWTANYNV